MDNRTFFQFINISIASRQNILDLSQAKSAAAMNFNSLYLHYKYLPQKIHQDYNNVMLRI